MLGEDLSRALGDISMEKIEKAAKMERRSGVYFWVKVAACAATVALVIGMAALMWPGEEKTGNQLEKPTSGMTAAPTLPTDVPPETLPKKIYAESGILKVYAYNKGSVSQDELAQYEVTDVVASKQTCWIEWTSSEYLGIKLDFYLPPDYYGDEEITFIMETAYGEYWGKHPETNKFASLGKKVETGNPGYISWKPGGDLEIMRETLNPSALYLRVLIYASNQPVGFGLLELNCQQLTKPDFYAVALLRFRTICYPLVDGQFQKVTEEYILEQIVAHEQVMLKEYEEWRTEKT